MVLISYITNSVILQIKKALKLKMRLLFEGPPGLKGGSGPGGATGAIVSFSI